MSTENGNTVSHDAASFHLHGEAKLKTQFVVHHHHRVLVDEYVSDKDKRKCTTSPDDSSKKKRLRGQNKHRPSDARIPRNEKLCPLIVNGSNCSYNEKCYYSHDVAKYLASKQENINDNCYLFETYGRCHYGVTCRFCSRHIANDNSNIVDETLWGKWKDKQLSANSLTKELQFKLRKKKYDFTSANQAIKSVQQSMQQRQKEELRENPLTEIDTKLVANNATSEHNDGTVLDDKNMTSLKMERLQTVLGSVTDEDIVRLRPSEIKRIDFTNKLYLAPLTTVGNLPFRRICKQYGADITCGEMALALNLLQGQQSEWALVKRHHSENIFGVQLSAPHGDIMAKCAQLLQENCHVDFIDINVGCPIDLIYQKGAGCALMNRLKKFEEIVCSTKKVLDIPLSVKIRTGVYENKKTAHTLIPKLRQWGCDLVSMHGRSREQRYTKSADWDYIDQCAQLARPMPLLGNGDILSYEEYEQRINTSAVTGAMIGRGALLKPWIFTEIKERRHWDISSRERFDVLREYVHFGLEHWGADCEGVEKTRRFLLEWLSFLHRYIPVGILERLPQRINERPPTYQGRDELETLMASPNCADWIKISEMLLGPVPTNFIFLPKHKANSYK